MIIPSGSLGSLFASLRHAVRRKLPSYMTPTIYVARNRRHMVKRNRGNVVVIEVMVGHGRFGNMCHGTNRWVANHVCGK
jgi:hypothetical protein